MNASWHADANTNENKQVPPKNPALAAFMYKQPALKRVGNSSVGPASTISKNDLISQVHTFSDNLRTSLVPQFDELETEVTDSISDFQRQLQSFDVVQSKAQALIHMFQQHVADTKMDLDGKLANLIEWSKEDRDITGLNLRLQNAREKLNVYKDRMDVLAQKVIETEQKKKTLRRPASQNLVIISLVVFLFGMLRWLT